MLLKANWAISSGAQAQPDNENVSASAQSWCFIKWRISARSEKSGEGTGAR